MVFTTAITVPKEVRGKDENEKGKNKFIPEIILEDGPHLEKL